jgi:hypothetical protein
VATGFGEVKYGTWGGGGVGVLLDYFGLVTK